jgi:hypothetical protein
MTHRDVEEIEIAARSALSILDQQERVVSPTDLTGGAPPETHRKST